MDSAVTGSTSPFEARILVRLTRDDEQPCTTLLAGALQERVCLCTRMEVHATLCIADWIGRTSSVSSPPPSCLVTRDVLALASTFPMPG